MFESKPHQLLSDTFTSFFIQTLRNQIVLTLTSSQCIYNKMLSMIIILSHISGNNNKQLKNGCHEAAITYNSRCNTVIEKLRMLDCRSHVLNPCFYI